MEKNIFWLENDQLKEIASSFREKVEEGLKHENAEIQCIPTFISPKTSIGYHILLHDQRYNVYRLLSLPKPLILMEKHWFSI